jgi:hypothetical protein
VLESVRDDLERFVADPMTERVIDQLEAVKIDEHDRHPF